MEYTERNFRPTKIELDLHKLRRIATINLKTCVSNIFFQSCSKIEGGKKMSEFSRGGQHGVWITHVGSFMFIGTTLNSALYCWRNGSNKIPVFEFLASNCTA